MIPVANIVITIIRYITPVVANPKYFSIVLHNAIPRQVLIGIIISHANTLLGSQRESQKK
jgi:hypothetical protein